jgi:outer membrane protein assembly factor BamA
MPTPSSRRAGSRVNGAQALRRAILACLGAAWLARVAAAAAQEAPSPAPPPPPAWASSRAKVPDAAAKVEGGFPDALPLIAYDTNLGLGLGVGGHYTYTGSRADPLFDYTPYRHRFYAQAYATTLGYQQHILSYDGFYVGDSPYRLRAVLTYERNTNANYFGTGTATLADLAFGGRSYSTYDAAANAAGPHYFHYGYERPQGQVLLERTFLGGRVRGLYGINVQYVAITRYDSAGAPSKLGSDCTAGLASGCSGGWNNTLRAGVSFDTRDFDPDPTSGVFVDSTGHWSAKGFGSYANYLRWTTAARAYVSPFPKFADVVVAGRVLYSIQSANVPFFAMNTLAMAGGTDDATDQAGLGGERTLRGYRQDRFIGPVAAAANVEVRWTFVTFPLLAQLFSLQIAPFVDTGRVFDRVELSFSDWKVAAGAGLRIGWNRSTIVMLDFGASREDTGFYIDFGMPF